jgi:hypothetical protein
MIISIFLCSQRFVAGLKGGLQTAAGALMALMVTFTPGMAQTKNGTLSDSAPPKVSLLDPQAVEILGAATDFLAGQSAMSVSWLVSAYSGASDRSFR